MTPGTSLSNVLHKGKDEGLREGRREVLDFWLPLIEKNALDKIKERRPAVYEFVATFLDTEFAEAVRECCEDLKAKSKL